VTRLYVDWSDPAIADLLDLPRDLAERVDAAVQLLAETGTGFVRSVAAEDGSTEHRLYVSGAWVRIGSTSTTLHVSRVHRSTSRR